MSWCKASRQEIAEHIQQLSDCLTALPEIADVIGFGYTYNDDMNRVPYLHLYTNGRGDVDTLARAIGVVPKFDGTSQRFIGKTMFTDWNMTYMGVLLGGSVKNPAPKLDPYEESEEENENK